MKMDSDWIIPVSWTKMSNWIRSSLLQAAWAPLMVVLLSAIADKLFNAYDIFPWIDIPFHISGGIAIAYFSYVSIANGKEIFGPVKISMLRKLALMGTFVAALIWEILELFIDEYFGMNTSLGWADTLSDIILGLIGGAIFITLRTRQKAERLQLHNRLTK